MKILLGLLFCVGVAMAKGPSIKFNAIRGGPHTMIDKLNISSDGNVGFSTISPSIGGVPNKIGHFSADIGERGYQELMSLIEKQKSSLPKNDHVKLRIAFEELHIGNETFRWQEDRRPKEFHEVVGKFKSIALQAYDHPIKALDLNCSAAENRIHCAYENIGEQTVRTVNPLEVSHSILCRELSGRVRALNPLAQYDPRKISPKIIEISPRKTFAFSVKSNGSCPAGVIVKTTGMIINKKYKDLLLGEIYSKRAAANDGRP